MAEQNKPKHPHARDDKRPDAKPQGRQGQAGAAPRSQGNLPPCGELNRINAPYNFVPLSEHVIVPDWAAQVSQDHPFRDGLCGTLEIELTTHSPLLLGGRQVKASDRAPGEVHPFRLPDGRYAIPGSALKGMLRNVLEIAAFGRMRQVDDTRYGLRDISGKYVQKSYTDAVHGQVRTGFMRLSGNGQAQITPCEMARLSHRDLEAWLGIDAPIFDVRQHKTVARKYARWQQLTAQKPAFRFDLRGQHAVPNDQGGMTGQPVFTGQIDNKKYLDFVFYAPRPTEAFPVSDEAWRDFLFVHGDADNQASMSWPGYWRNRYFQGEEVPVFYLQRHGKLHIGLAYLPKLAGDYSVVDLIGHTGEDHREAAIPAARFDLPDLLFGALGAQPDDALKGRVSVGLCIAEGTPALHQSQPTVLNGPKASYFPNYLKQAAQPNAKGGWQLDGNQYATYMQLKDMPEPEIRGWKRYPARPKHEVQALGAEANNKKIQVELHALKAPCRFRGRIQVHNLRPAELGALAWAITWGGNESLRHGLGMGKPFGFGQVSLRITHAQLVANDPAAGVPDWQDCMRRFEQWVEDACRARGLASWRQSEPLTQLLAMADPKAASGFAGKLEHMKLSKPCENKKGEKSTTNEFVDAKKNGLVLAPYVASNPAGTSTNKHKAGPAEPQGVMAEKLAALRPQLNRS